MFSLFPGIVKQDPVLPDDKLLPPPPPRAKSAIFEDEEKSKVCMTSDQEARMTLDRHVRGFTYKCTAFIVLFFFMFCTCLGLSGKIASNHVKWNSWENY